MDSRLKELERIEAEMVAKEAKAARKQSRKEKRERKQHRKEARTHVKQMQVGMGTGMEEEDVDRLEAEAEDLQTEIVDMMEAHEEVAAQEEDADTTYEIKEKGKRKRRRVIPTLTPEEVTKKKALNLAKRVKRDRDKFPAAERQRLEQMESLRVPDGLAIAGAAVVAGGDDAGDAVISNGIAGESEELSSGTGAATQHDKDTARMFADLEQRTQQIAQDDALLPEAERLFRSEYLNIIVNSVVVSEGQDEQRDRTHAPFHGRGYSYIGLQPPPAPYHPPLLSAEQVQSFFHPPNPSNPTERPCINLEDCKCFSGSIGKVYSSLETRRTVEEEETDKRWKPFIARELLLPGDEPADLYWTGRQCLACHLMTYEVFRAKIVHNGALLPPDIRTQNFRVAPNVAGQFRGDCCVLPGKGAPGITDPFPLLRSDRLTRKVGLNGRSYLDIGKMLVPPTSTAGVGSIPLQSIIASSSSSSHPPTAATTTTAPTPMDFQQANQTSSLTFSLVRPTQPQTQAQPQTSTSKKSESVHSLLSFL